MFPLPVELQAAIIDCMANNKHSLSAIALVWPEVLFRIRERRFTTCTLQTATQAAGLLDILQSNPAISCLIHTVRIGDSRVYAEPKLPHLFSILSHVSTINFFHIHYSSGTKATLRGFSGPYNHVKDAHLDFRRRSGMTRLSLDIDGLSIFLRMLPNVERLKLNFNPSVATGGRTQTQLASLRSLHLSLQVLKAPAFLDQFLEWIVLPNVSTLYLEGLVDIGSLNKALRLWGNTLKELHLPFPDDGGMTASALTLDLPDGIEVVEFCIVIGDSSENESYIDMWARTLEDRARSQCPTPRCISLKIGCWCKWEEAQGEPFLTLVRRLDAAIASPRLAVKCLDWTSDLGEAEHASSSAIYETFFPEVYDRFISPAGRLKYGTTCKIYV